MDIGFSLNPCPRKLGAVHEHLRRRYEHLLGKIQDTHAQGWHPETRLSGADHLQAALARGNGVVLWGMSFCGSLVPKMALHQAGFPVTHLSTPYHGGPSRSRATVQVLNRWHTASENKYLSERVVIPFNGSIGYLRQLKKTLRRNGCVSISGEAPGRRNVSATCLGERVAFAVGAPHLAHSTGAALVTHYTRRLGPGRYQTVIEPPIDIDEHTGRRDARRVAVEAFASRLERQVRSAPADWDGWTAERPRP